jgi:hypothetical protein
MSGVLLLLSLDAKSLAILHQVSGLARKLGQASHPDYSLFSFEPSWSSGN